ncbi:tyrosine-protein phosphatase [Halobacillus sp. Marseille-Q1614]|uniref:tyrosine-protein phosphatase n=1 Tax=Halobacillus sp. Marseille-Q1614 TaxID=2709134 RepID=UPI00156ED3BD|nr:CpsB/CapC family capsule biosynthesis tyrosine phosphatase [Halobacillus sp. Marseille-Q1614]
MIDIHSHILPGIDDGPQSMEDSIELAKAAVEQGIDTIVATPHHNNGSYNNYRSDILLQVKALNEQLKLRRIDLSVLPGQETRIYGEMVEGIHKGEILAINNTTPYVFVELPRDHVPQYIHTLIFNMQVEGYQPIIVHPERNEQIQENPNLLYTLVKNGAFSQVTAGSLCGKFGRDAKKIAHQLIDHNLTHVLASDVHFTKKRRFYLQEAYNMIRKQHGTEAYYALMENAQAVIEGEPLISDPPEHIKKKKAMFIF